MTMKQFIKHLENLLGSVTFDYHGNSCGVDPINKNHYDIWYGDILVTVESIAELLKSDIFDGKTIVDIFSEIENVDY